jgi:hypothetical protein
MSWRYQPVYVEQDGERIYSMCEVHFDDDEQLKGFTDADCAPSGEDIDSLCRDIVMMAVDARSWEPIAYSELCAGMRFKRRLTMEQRNDVANFIKASVDTFKRQPKPRQN